MTDEEKTSVFTRAFAINARGQIVGRYQDADGKQGFLLSEGKFTSIDFPGSILTNANDINTRGEIVGCHDFLGAEIRSQTGYTLWS